MARLGVGANGAEREVSFSQAAPGRGNVPAVGAQRSV
jgi:hypothetical protein